MVAIEQLNNKLKEYILNQVTNLAKDNPIISFAKPLITRAIDKNFTKVSKLIDLISDAEGNVDIENILTEMTESVMNTAPFTFNTGFGDIEIGGGIIKLQIPLVNKSLVFNSNDLASLKEILTSKS